MLGGTVRLAKVVGFSRAMDMVFNINMKFSFILYFLFIGINRKTSQRR